MGRVLGALACFVVFGAVAVAMGMTTRNDWRAARDRHDVFLTYLAIKQWLPVLIAAAVAVAGPVIILMG